MPSVMLRRPRERARRQVVPVPVADVAVIGDDVADRGERQRQRVRGDFADAVVGRIGDPDAGPLAGFGVDRVVPRADAAHDAELGQRGDDLRAVIGAYCRRIARQPRAMRDHVVLGLALRDHDLDAGRREQRALEVEVGVVVDRRRGSGACGRRREASEAAEREGARKGTGERGGGQVA